MFLLQLSVYQPINAHLYMVVMDAEFDNLLIGPPGWRHHRLSSTPRLPHAESITEPDTCRKYVVPLLVAAGWDNDPHSIAEQKTFTDGGIIDHGLHAKRRHGKRPDYLLRHTRDFPVAVVEAKAIFKKPAAYTAKKVRILCAGPEGLLARWSRRRGFGLIRTAASEPGHTVVSCGPPFGFFYEL